MAFSVNTNQGAFVALQQLSETNKQLAITQNRINTGLKVASAKDGAATFAIAQNIRADVAGINAVKSSLDRSISAVDVALNAAESIADLLTQLRETAVAASDPGLDSQSRSALQDEFQQTLKQIDSIVQSASFNGTNLVSAANSVVAIDSDGNAIFSVQGAGLTVSDLGVSSTFATATAAQSVVGEIDSAVATVNNVLSDLGAGRQRLDLQATFISKLQDTLNVGIGNLVDADLAKESANLQALQVKQQLGLQALSIANQAPGSILALFR